jgi:hypothetical protein
MANCGLARIRPLALFAAVTLAACEGASGAKGSDDLIRLRADLDSAEEGRRRAALNAVCGTGRSWRYGGEAETTLADVLRAGARDRSNPLRPSYFDALACLPGPRDAEFAPVVADSTEAMGTRMAAVELVDPARAEGERALAQALAPETRLQLRIAAARRLGGGCRTAIPHLRAHAFDPDPAFASTVVESLATVGAGDALGEIIASAPGATNQAALTALGRDRPGLEATIPALRGLLQDPSRRYDALRALEQRGIAAVPTLVAALASADPNFRRNAADALGRLRQTAKEAVPALRELKAGDPDRAVRDAAARALGEIGGTLDEVAREVEDARDDDERRRALARVQLYPM